MGDHALDELVALGGTGENVPCVSWHVPEGVLETLWLVLAFDTDSRNIFNLADENKLDPVGELSVAN